MISYSFCFVFWHCACFQTANHRWLVWSCFVFTNYVTNYLLSVTTMKWSRNHVCFVCVRTYLTVYLLVPTFRPSCTKFANITDLVMKSTCWSHPPQSKVSCWRFAYCWGPCYLMNEFELFIHWKIPTVRQWLCICVLWLM